MWIFTKDGFFSAIEHFENPAIIHVRARFEGDLERLCEANRVEPKIDYTPENDYPYRMNFGRDEWTKIVAKECEEIDYTNFKGRAHDGTERDGAYLDCWAALRRASEKQRCKREN